MVLYLIEHAFSVVILHAVEQEGRQNMASVVIEN